MDPIVALVILLIHLGVLVWAVANRDPWWAIGIFLFPIVGDIVYVIYYFGSQGPRPSRSTGSSWQVQEGDLVETRVRIGITGSNEVIPKGTTLTVRDVQDNRVRVEDPSGVRYRLYTEDLSLIRRAQGNPPPLPGTGAEMPPAKRYADELRELAALRDDGLITEEEFTAKKRKLLGID